MYYLLSKSWLNISIPFGINNLNLQIENFYETTPNTCEIHLFISSLLRGHYMVSKFEKMKSTNAPKAFYMEVAD